MNRQTLTNAASHVRRVTQRYSLLDAAVRRMDQLRHPELRDREALLASTRRLRSELRSLSRADRPPELLISGPDAWLRRETAWFLVRLETIPLVLETFEASEATVLAASVQPNGRFVDIGANFGLHSVLLATRFPDLTIDAFEPVPGTVELLRANATRNRCERLRIHACAVADFNGEISVTSQLATGNHLLPAMSVIAPQSIRVPTLTLDSFWEREGRPTVDAVKIDVEGAEWHVLRGGAKFFSERPLLLVELAEEWLRRYQRTVGQCLALLAGYGYRFARPIGAGRDSSWTEISGLRTESSGNYVFSSHFPVDS
jgi:FkbM family methyltransferase